MNFIEIIQFSDLRLKSRMKEFILYYKMQQVLCRESEQDEISESRNTVRNAVLMNSMGK
jgi:hypothetical protein